MFHDGQIDKIGQRNISTEIIISTNNMISQTDQYIQFNQNIILHYMFKQQSTDQLHHKIPQILSQNIRDPPIKTNDRQKYYILCQQKLSIPQQQEFLFLLFLPSQFLYLQTQYNLKKQPKSHSIKTQIPVLNTYPFHIQQPNIAFLAPNLKKHFTYFNPHIRYNNTFLYQLVQRSIIFQIQMYKEKAIPLVTVDPEGKYIFQEEAADFLRSLQGPIGVISVAGLYRTGKSYLLNRMLLNRSNGFGVGSTINACTKGLWVWGTPIKGTSADGEPINIIVIDTEGIGAVDEDSTHDTKIFTLAILASSCFIYNSSGSIDEGAIQNLSLVVNLTKHIHLKTQSKQQQDPDEFSNFFPSFFWVVRDFSLQLVDTHGHSITSQQYLQNALAVQKGNSMDLDEKNRIRKLLTAFFKERQCFTLVRPHSDEDKLRQLDLISFDQLRPEFVQQVLNFRKRLLNRMKPKVINQKKLNGQMYSSLMNNYVKAINEGAVPNIQNAWNYMCREQCQKVSAESYQLFENKLKENLSHSWPCTEQNFKAAAKGAKDVAYELFKKKAFGENIQEYFTQLKKRMKSKINTFRVQNQKESASTMQNFIIKNFAHIERKLKLQQFKTYAEFEKTLAQFYNQLIQKGPKLVNRQIVCLEFMKKILPQGAGFFFKVHENQYEKLKTISEEKQKTMQNTIKNLKEDMSREKSSATEKLCSVDKEKMQMTLKIQKLQDEIKLLSKDKQNESHRLSEALQTKNSELDSIKRSLQSRLQQLNNKNDQMNSKFLTGQRQWDKDKAVFEQKIKLLSQQVEDYQKKQKLFDSTINSSKSQFSFEIKEAAIKFQKKISDLTFELNDSKEKFLEISEQLKSLKQELQNNKDKFDKKERKYKQDLSQRIKELERMKHETQLEKNRIESEYLNEKDQLSKDFRESIESSRQQQATIKTLNDQLKSQKNSYDKDVAILNQKLQFAEESLRDTKQQLAEVKRNHEMSLAAMEEANGKLREESQNQRIIQLKNLHLSNIKQIQIDHQQIKKKLQFDLDTLNRNKNDIQLKITLLESTLLKERQTFQEVKKSSDDRIQELTCELNNLERLKSGKMKEQEVVFENKIRQLERELEQSQQKANYEQRQSHNKSQQAITQLKNYYEMERDKLESKIGIQKEKAEKKLKKTIEELQQKHKDEVNTLEEENQELKGELVNIQSNLQAIIMDLQHTKDLKTKQIQGLQRSLNDLKETFGRRETEMNTKYENLFQQSKTQKQAQYQKLQILQTQNNSKQKVIMTLTHTKDQLQTTLQKKESLIDEQKREIVDLRANSEKTTQELRRKYQDLSNQYLDKKINYQKSIALITQESEYNARKAKDYEKQLETNSASFEERMKAVKEEALLQINSSKEKEESVRIALDTKYQNLKKCSRETEARLQKSVVELEKQKALDNEKYLTLQQRYKDLQQKRVIEIETLNNQLVAAKQSLVFEKKALQSDVERLKVLNGELENAKSQAVSEYEKDRILWENKVNFLEQQKQQNKVEYTEKIQKLQSALENQQKTRMNQQSNAKNNYNEYVSKLQKKYLSQIHELTEDKTKRSMQHESSIKELEMNLKNMREKYELDIQSKNSNYQNIEKRLNQLTENEKKLQSEVERMRQEKDLKSSQYSKMMDQQKENMKNRTKQIQQKLRKMENDKRSLFFEHEKEKAKWNYEEQHRKQKIESLVEQVQKNASEIQKLQRENERLKAQKKNSKVSGAPSFISKYGHYGGDKSPALNKSAIGVSDNTFVLNSSDIHSEDRQNDPVLKPINF